MLGTGQQLRSAWFLDQGAFPYADDILLTQFAPQNAKSAGAGVFSLWWFGPQPPVVSSTSGLGQKLHSAWMLDLEFHCAADRLLQTQFLPQNKNSAGGVVLTNWWFPAGFIGAAFRATTGKLGVSISVPLVGISITSTAGTLTPFGVSGVSQLGYIPAPGPGIGPFANAQFTPQIPGYSFGVTVPLVGSAINSAAGTLVPTVAPPLTGSAITSAAGTLAPVSGVTVALVGQSFAAAAGNLAPSVTVPLTGSGATLSPGTIIGSSGFRVMATAIGFYGGILFGPGDVFDILQSSDFSDSSVDYAAGQPGDPEFGWMKRVPSSTPLTYPLTNPIYDYQNPPRRTVY